MWERAQGPTGAPPSWMSPPLSPTDPPTSSPPGHHPGTPEPAEPVQTKAGKREGRQGSLGKGGMQGGEVSEEAPLPLGPGSSSGIPRSSPLQALGGQAGWEILCGTLSQWNTPTAAQARPKSPSVSSPLESWDWGAAPPKQNEPSTLRRSCQGELRAMEEQDTGPQYRHRPQLHPGPPGPCPGRKACLRPLQAIRQLVSASDTDSRHQTDGQAPHSQR